MPGSSSAICTLTGRHAEAGLSLKLGDLLAVGEHDDDRRAHGLAVLALLLRVAENRPHRALRDLLRNRIAFVLVVILVVILAAARLDLGRIVFAVDIGRLEIFCVGLLDGLGKAWGRIGGAWLAEQDEGQQQKRTQTRSKGHWQGFPEATMALAPEERVGYSTVRVPPLAQKPGPFRALL